MENPLTCPLPPRVGPRFTLVRIILFFIIILDCIRFFWFDVDIFKREGGRFWRPNRPPPLSRQHSSLCLAEFHMASRPRGFEASEASEAPEASLQSRLRGFRRFRCCRGLRRPSGTPKPDTLEFALELQVEGLSDFINFQKRINYIDQKDVPTQRLEDQ